MRLTAALALLLLVSATWDRQCQLGPGVQLLAGSKDDKCRWADLDHDGDVDQSDYGLFQASDGKVVVVFIVDLSLRSMSDPESCVRDILDAREAQRR